MFLNTIYNGMVIAVLQIEQTQQPLLCYSMLYLHPRLAQPNLAPSVRLMPRQIHTIE